MQRDKQTDKAIQGVEFSPKSIWQPWVMVRYASSVIKREEDFISLRISNLPEGFPNRGDSEEKMHWVQRRRSMKS